MMKEKRINMAVLLEDLEFGGTQRYAIHLLRHLDRRRFSPQLWVLRGGRDMVPLARETGVEITWFSKSSYLGPKAMSGLLRKLIRRRPEMLYTLTIAPNIWGRVLGKLTGVPIIVSGYRSLLPRQLERWLWPLSRKIICNAETLKQLMVHKFSVDPRRIAVIPNSVDTELFSPSPDQKALEPTVVYIGRMVNEKAPMNLLKSFTKVLQAVPKARLLMVGDGRLSKQLKTAVYNLSLELNVEIIPASHNIVSYLNRAWVFALASLREASPNVVIEAMAAGLPVVATRVGGIPELVEEGETGLLVDPGDLEGLANALTSLLTNENQRRAMGLKARKRILARHSMEEMIRRTEKVLLETIDGRYCAR